MAFTQSTFAPVSSHSSNTPNLFSYKTDDTLAQVQVIGYFAQKSFQIEEGDFFFIFASDGSNVFRSIGGQIFPFVSIGLQTIVEADGTYQALVSDDIINCDGTFTVTFPDIADATKEFTISSTDGTITLEGDATIEGASTITTGGSTTFYPARGQWWIK